MTVIDLAEYRAKRRRQPLPVTVQLTVSGELVQYYHDKHPNYPLTYVLEAALSHCRVLIQLIDRGSA